MEHKVEELEILAEMDNLQEAMSFIEDHLMEAGCPMKAMMQITVAAEEIFVNIAHYAYAPEAGKATLRLEVAPDPIAVTITFIDHGKPFDPLQKAEPDLTASVEDRQVGGLGIFMTKKIMDDVRYEYRDGQNILTMKKKL